MLVRRTFLTVFFGLRKVRFECYCAHFQFSQMVLVLKLLPTTIFIIVKTLVLIPFVEGSLWRIQMLVRRLFLTVFFRLPKYVSNATVLISSSIRLSFRSNYFQRPFLSSLKLWFRYLSQKTRNGGFKCLFEGLLSQFFSVYEKYVSNATVLISSSIRLFFCSNYYHRSFLSSLKLWFRYLSQNTRYGGFKCWFEGLFSQFFSNYQKYVSNATVLISSSIRLFLFSNYFQRPFLSSLNLLFRYLSQKPRNGGFKCWFEGLFSQFFSHFEKYVSNATVLISSSIRLFFCSNYF